LIRAMAQLGEQGRGGYEIQGRSHRSRKDQRILKVRKNLPSSMNLYLVVEADSSGNVSGAKKVLEGEELANEGIWGVSDW